MRPKPLPALSVNLAAGLGLGLWLCLSGCGGDRADTTTPDGATTTTASAPTAPRSTMDLDAIAAKLPAGTKVIEPRDAKGNLVAQGFLNDGEPVGPWVYYWPNGQVQSQGSYHYHGIRTGTWQFYHTDGKLHAEGDYDHDKREGPWRFWYSNGQLAMEGRYHLDRRIGTWTAYHEGGMKAIQGTYADGTPSGLWTYWDSFGRSLGESQFQQARAGLMADAVVGGRREFTQRDYEAARAAKEK